MSAHVPANQKTSLRCPEHGGSSGSPADAVVSPTIQTRRLPTESSGRELAAGLRSEATDVHQDVR